MINNSIFREFSSCSILLSSDFEVTWAFLKAKMGGGTKLSIR
jgi:hypothetical protein